MQYCSTACSLSDGQGPGTYQRARYWGSAAGVGCHGGMFAGHLITAVACSGHLYSLADASRLLVHVTSNLYWQSLGKSLTPFMTPFASCCFSW